VPTLSIGRRSPALAPSSSPAAARSLASINQQSSASAPYPAPPPSEGMFLCQFHVTCVCVYVCTLMWVVSEQQQGAEQCFAFSKQKTTRTHRWLQAAVPTTPSTVLAASPRRGSSL
jgi:hypothetical protein